MKYEHTIFLDCDGVFSDFINQILRVLEYPFVGDICHSWTWGHVMDVFPSLGTSWLEVSKFCNYDFWATLPWTIDGREILKVVWERFRPNETMMLTRPMNNDESYSGKAQWVLRNMPELRYRLVPTHVPKEEFAGDFNHLLIDDSQSNVERFIKAGGSAILVPRPWNQNDTIFYAGDTVSYVANMFDEWIRITNHPAGIRKEQHV